MAEDSYPTAAGGSVTDAKYELLMAPATGDGLIGRPGFHAPLAFVNSTDRQIRLHGNRGAIVRGFRWSTDINGVILPINANTSGQTRIDTIVLRLNRSNGYQVRAAVIQGAASSSPTAPPPVYSDPPGFYDLPVAQVTVRDKVQILGPGDVRETTWYLAEPALVGTSALLPPSLPGRIFRQHDLNTTLIGDNVGSWDTLSRDSGWLDQDLTAGFTGKLQLRRKNDVVFLQFGLERSGALLAAGAASTVATIGTPSYRPVGDSPIYDSVQIHAQTNPHSSVFYVATSGAIVITGNNVNPIQKGAALHGSASWPVSW